MSFFIFFSYALGKTKVFLKYYHIEYLSKQYEYQIRKIVRVQAVVRRWLAALKFRREKWAVARSLFLMRVFCTRWKVTVTGGLQEFTGVAVTAILMIITTEGQADPF